MCVGVLYGGVVVHVGQEPKAEAVLVVGWVGEAVHEYPGGGGVVGLALFQFVVDDEAPVAQLLILHRPHVSAALHQLVLIAQLLIRGHVGQGRGVSWELEWAEGSRAGWIRIRLVVRHGDGQHGELG